MNNTAQLMAALSEGPRLADDLELRGVVRGRLCDAVKYFNEFHARIGSHWRVRGRAVYHKDSAGDERRSFEYVQVMELGADAAN